jgi:hypothetical protein
VRQRAPVRGYILVARPRQGDGCHPSADIIPGGLQCGARSHADAQRTFGQPRACTVAADAQTATAALATISDAPYGALAVTVRDGVALEAGAISALGQAAQDVEYDNAQYPWTSMSSYISQLSSAVQTLAAACTSTSVPVSTKAPYQQSSAAAGSTDPATCPGSAQLLTTWGAAAASTRRSWAGPGLTVAGFDSIACWDGWVVATPIADGNGTFVFAQQSGLHLLPASELNEFNSAVCSSPDSPADWKNPAAGPANCPS